jgi:hypothetical protein
MRSRRITGLSQEMAGRLSLQLRGGNSYILSGGFC